MNSQLRFWLVVVSAAMAAVTAAWGIAQENYLVAGVLAAGVPWLLLEWKRGPLPEAWLLAALCIGYLLGNRGFAQLFLLPTLPLLPAEAVLLVAVPALLVRMAFKTTGIARDGLNFAILGWIALGAARLPLDVRHFGFPALRDFATLYYAAFFFLAQALASHAPSSRLLARSLTLGFSLLPGIVLIERMLPDFFLEHLVWRGTPLIFHKSDLTAGFLACGFFWLWSRRQQGGHWLWLLGAALNLLLVGAMESPRAAMVAIAGVTLLWLAHRTVKLLRFQLLVAAAALVVLWPLESLVKHDFRQTSVYSAYEHAVSILDFTGSRAYQNQQSGDPGDNNRFRLVWWRSVARETMETNPALGLGFGYDLAARFLVEYDWLTNEDFSARSPHSIVMTVFGRMGAVGLLLWLAIAFFMARATTAAFRERRMQAMGLWSVVWTLWISACFGVVLEGPMGAVLYWIVLGLANAAGFTAVVAGKTKSAADPTEIPASSLPTHAASVSGDGTAS